MKVQATWSTSQADRSAGTGGLMPLGASGDEESAMNRNAMKVPPNRKAREESAPFRSR